MLFPLFFRAGSAVTSLHHGTGRTTFFPEKSPSENNALFLFFYFISSIVSDSVFGGNIMKKIKILLILTLLIFLLSGCSMGKKEILSIADVKDQALSVALADDLDRQTCVLNVCPKAQILSQNDDLLGLLSVSEGKVDAAVQGRTYLEKMIRETGVQNIRILEEPVLSYPCALGLSRHCAIPDFENTVNRTLEALIQNGTLEEMWHRWFEQDNSEMPQILLDDEPAWVVNAVTNGESPPFSFVKDEQLTGFDVELLYRICAENHWGVDLSHVQYPSMLLGLSTGKYDMASANLFVSEERAENVVFSIPFRSEEIVMAVRNNSASSSSKQTFSSISDLKNAKSFAIQTGTIFDTVIKEHFPQAKIQYYPTPADAAIALANGKVDAAVHDAPLMEYISTCTEGTVLLPETLMQEDYYFILSPSEYGKRLQGEFNEWLAVQKQTGEAQRIYDFWCSKEEPENVFDFSALPNINGHIRIGTDVVGRPDSYYCSNSLAGYPVELIYRFCRDKGYSAELSVIDFGGALSSLASGKNDIFIALLSYTEERAQSVLYSDSIATGGIGILVRATEEHKNGSFINAIQDGFEKTFIRENRWKLALSGLGITFLITVAGFLLANVLGAGLCACMMSRHRGLRILADGFDRIMQGTPMVVILMVLYYVIFGKSNISGIWVAVFAFGLNSGASLARLFYGAIIEVDRGQREAALAIGFTKFEAFKGIVIPQAARSALVSYFSEIISLMKGSAIVGYIAVTDLTKAGDLIRSSTYDAFFPLLSIALIYFLISFAILSLLKLIRKKLAPKRATAKEAEK